MRNINVKILVISALIIVVVMLTIAYLALFDSNEAPKNQQQSLSPVFKLVSDEIVKPLRTAQTTAQAQGLDKMMDNPIIMHQDMLDKVAELSRNLNMNFFVASENSRRQYNADGSWLALKEGQVEWYFRAREKNQEVMVSLGQRENVHIYYDLRINDASGNFLGFIGVSKDLDGFLTTFEEYRKSLGYDFVFISDNQNVVLSSNATQMANGIRILSLSDLDWYQALNEKQKNLPSLNNAIVSVQGTSFKIVELDLSMLNWKLYLLTPSANSNSTQSYFFTPKTVLILALIIFAFMGVPLLMLHLSKKDSKSDKSDRPNKFHNRVHLLEHFDDIRKTQQALCLIIVDIDQFRLFNDNYGRHTGDQMLSGIRELLEANLREGDAVARWGNSDEFVILLPATELNKANTIAELLRSRIAKHTLNIDGNIVSVSASFGITYTKHANTIERLVSYADDALYQAKRDGLSTIRMQLVDTA